MVDGSFSLIDIPDGKPVRAFLPIAQTKDRFRVPCTFTYFEEKKFYLNFNLGILPSEGIEVSGTAFISIDIGGLNTSIEALVIETTSSQRLLLEMQSTFTHDQLREFFRVDAVTKVIGETFHTTAEGGDHVQVEGQTVDISGSGILATFSDNLSEDENVKLHISLPNDTQDVISVIARKTRAHKLSNGQWEIALHFEEIRSEDRDKIIGCCLVLQRKLLRLKVQISS